jgi:acylphosphatase
MATRIIFSGTVQGVGFRWHVKKTADRLGITGFVRNLPDGTVDAVCSGTDEDIIEFIEACRTGSLAQVIRVKKEHAASEDWKGFSIRR